MTANNTISISELQQQANDGDTQAQFELAYCYAKGENVEENKALTLHWLNKSAEQGFAKAQLTLGLLFFIDTENPNTVEVLNDWFKAAIHYLYLHKETVNKDFGNYTMKLFAMWHLDADDAAYIDILNSFNFIGFGNELFCSPKEEFPMKDKTQDISELAYHWLKKAAEQDYPLAQFWLSLCYRFGIGTIQNDESAFQWLKSAADHGIAKMQYRLAQCYFHGLGVPQNNELAFELYKKAAEQGVSNAQYELAQCYFNGTGVQRDEELAINLFEELAGKGHAESAMRLAECYTQGLGEEKSDELALKWYEKAAEHEVAEAQYRLALCYFEGRGIEKSYELGIKWMISAAGKSHSEANNWLTNAYLSLAIPSCILNKDEVEQYYKFAVDWCLKEVDGHNAVEANLLLGILYYSGKGVEQSDDRAIDYFEKAEYMAYAGYDQEYDFDNNEDIGVFASLFVGICYAQGKSITTYYSPKQNGFRMYEGQFDSWDLRRFGEAFVEGIVAMPFHKLQHNKVFLTLLRISVFKKAGEYELAKEFTKEVFDNTDGMDKNFKEICLIGIEQEQELAEKNKALKSEIKQKEALNKALHEKEKEMLSFFTHTMRNALATAPQLLKEAIHLLGGEDYEKDTKHYKAINKIAALFSTLSLTDCLIDTFKQSISDPQEFKQSWQKDHTGDATAKWVIASALRQSLNRIIFMSDATELRKLLNNQETALIKATRKSFIENVLPLNVDHQGVDVFYDWALAHTPAIEVSIANCDTQNFGVNQIRFSLLFAITSELILNALKYWDGEDRIQISWKLAEQDNYVFSIKNHCKANATSNLAGTHKGLAFIKRLVELLGEQARFECKSENQLFIAELTLNKILFESES